MQRSYGLEYGNDSLAIQESAIAPYEKFVIIDRRAIKSKLDALNTAAVSVYT